MKTRRETLEQEIQHLLHETMAENDALKKLVTALQEEDLRITAEKSGNDKSNNQTIQPKT